LRHKAKAKETAGKVKASTMYYSKPMPRMKNKKNPLNNKAD